jgi:hypothetical protein
MVLTDTEIRRRGMNALIEALGEADAARFVTLLLRESLDYTQWHRTLWADKRIEAISQRAMDHRREDRD